jgi:aspartate aminotransferase
VLGQYPDVWILAHGLYEQIVFDGDCAPALADVEPRLKARTLTVGGTAKTYAMMGWRIDYAAGFAELIREMIRIQSQTTSCASSISQAAAVAALNDPQDLLRERACVLRGKRDRLVALLNDCAGVSCIAPEGTFYLLVSCAGAIGKHSPNGTEIRTDRDFCRPRRTSRRGLRSIAFHPGQFCKPGPDAGRSGPAIETGMRGAVLTERVGTGLPP